VKDPRLAVIYGRDARRLARALLEDAAAGDSPPALPSPGHKVLLKPNLVTSRPASTGATTTPEVVAGVIEFLQDRGVGDITVAEGSWTGCPTERAFRACGYLELSRRYGVKLVDLKKDSWRPLRAGELELKVCRRALETDFFINLPVLKGHCQTGLTCALKNLKGCLPDEEKRRFHALGLHRPIALLASVLPTHLTLVDALCGDLVFEEGGTPVRLDRLLLGRDPVLVDSFGASLMGYAPAQIEHLRLAASLAVGGMDLALCRLREIGRPPADAAQPAGLPRSLARLSARIQAREACSACYGGLLHALKRLEQAGELERAPGPLRVGQGFRGLQGEGWGIGACTRGQSRHLPGCPPSAAAILAFLRAIPRVPADA
jgi:uncharacterized protein (DUF362 family)